MEVLVSGYSNCGVGLLVDDGFLFGYVCFFLVYNSVFVCNGGLRKFWLFV